MVRFKIGEVSNIRGLVGDSYSGSPDDSIDYIESGEVLNAFQSFLRAARERYYINEQSIVFCNQDREDLLHAIELNPVLNACDGNKVYKIMRDVSIERRRAKDENDVLEPIIEFLDRNPKIIEEIDKAGCTSAARKRHHGQRRYVPRGSVLERIKLKRWAQ